MPKFDLPTSILPQEVVFNPSHLEVSGASKDERTDERGNGWLLGKLQRIFGGAASRDLRGANPPAVNQIVFPGANDDWGQFLEGHGEKFRVKRPLTPAEYLVALGMLFELSLSAVVRAQQLRPDPREVFFPASHGWHSDFPQLRAIWDESESVIVFFAAAFGDQFRPWASRKPKAEHLLQIIAPYSNDVIVVVPGILPMDAALLALMVHERGLIWPDD